MSDGERRRETVTHNGRLSEQACHSESLASRSRSPANAVSTARPKNRRTLHHAKTILRTVNHKTWREQPSLPVLRLSVKTKKSKFGSITSPPPIFARSRVGLSPPPKPSLTLFVLQELRKDVLPQKFLRDQHPRPYHQCVKTTPRSQNDSSRT